MIIGRRVTNRGVDSAVVLILRQTQCYLPSQEATSPLFLVLIG